MIKPWMFIPRRLPSGIIIMSADGSTPTGWTRFSAADGKFIVGAGSTYAVAATGGSATVSASADSGYGGLHSGTTHGVYDCGLYAASIYGEDDTTSGSHSHSIAATAYTPKKQNMTLIKANNELATVPAQGMFFATSTIAGFSVFSSSSFLFGAASVSETALAKTVTCSSDGSHNHGLTSQIKDGVDPQSARTSSTGNHTHTLTVSAFDNFKNAIFRGLYKATAYGLKSGLIALWEGTTAPQGWKLCDGNTGTVDLRDYFILFSVTGDGTRAGTNSVALTIGIDTNTWTHSHSSGSSDIDTSAPGLHSYSGTGNASHSHTHAGLTLSAYTPVYYALTFIQSV